MKKFLSLSATYDRLGRAMFGNAYIDRLTDKEEWILEQVGPAERLSSHQPGLILRDRHPLPWPHPAISPEEARQAIQRLHLLERQETQLEAWLAERPIARDADDGVHQLSFERELARAFPASATRPSSTSAEDEERGVWLIREILRRRDNKETHGRDAMVIALRGAFPGITKRTAQALYQAVPKEVRLAKMGRPRGEKAARKKSGPK